MRKMTTAFLILALLIAGWVTESVALGTMSKNMTEKLDMVCAALESDNFSEAAILTDDFCDSWYKSESWVAMLATHDTVDEISRNAAKMKTYSKSGGKDDSIATVSETKELLNELERKTHVNLMNIF
jgi:hypothetical protein